MKILSFRQTAFLLVAALVVVQFNAPSANAEDFKPQAITTSPGALDEGIGHVQGICCDEDAIYAIFTNQIYKIDWTGKVVKSAPVVQHAGDPCIANDKLCVSMSYDEGVALHEYDFELNLTRKIKLEDCPASDGVAYLDGKFYVGGPSDYEPHEDNLVLVYDSDFNLIQKALVNFDVETHYGPQSIAGWNGKIFIAFYARDNAPAVTLRSLCLDDKMNNVASFTLDGSNGWYPAPKSKQSKEEDSPLFLIGRTIKIDGKTAAKFIWAQYYSKTNEFNIVAQ
ncbi:MAG: hypothetical protein PHO46_02360 [Thermoguttaceae bacterium]|nr:hypothetical protein [Thermoguttaceae bacterium]